MSGRTSVKTTELSDLSGTELPVRAQECSSKEELIQHARLVTTRA